MKKIFILLLFVFSCSNTVFAQEQETVLGISPTIVEEVLTPGETKIRKIRLFNLTDRPLPIKAQARDFLGAQDDELELDEKVSSKEWITLQPSDFIIEPRTSQEILLTIQPPINAAPGGHYASVFFTPVLPVDYIQNSKPKVLTRMSVQQLYLVRGETVEKMEVNHFRTTKDFYFGEKPMFEINFGNNGNVHLLPRGKIEISPIFLGKEIAIEPDNRVILPKTSRKIDKESPDLLSWGKYRAKLVANYGPENKRLESQVYEFWVLPGVHLILLTLAVGITMMNIIRVLIKKVHAK